MQPVCKRLGKESREDGSMHLYTAVHDDQVIHALINPRLQLLKQLMRFKIICCGILFNIFGLIFLVVTSQVGF